MWVSEQEIFLRELIRLEGRGDSLGQELCGECNERVPEYRCRDCFGTTLYCKTCTVARHYENPCHRVQVGLSCTYSPSCADETTQQWNGTFFECVALKKLGLRVQLGHRVGETCINPKPASGDDFVLLDTQGIHEIGLDYCDCETAESPQVQLLRNRWFGATVANPKTAATIRLLEHFHYQNLESKASAFEFYHAIMRETDNTGLREPKVRMDTNAHPL
jgi:hypothetical protein